MFLFRKEMVKGFKKQFRKLKVWLNEVQAMMIIFYQRMIR